MDSEKFEKKPLKNHIFKTFTLSTKGGFKGEKIANNTNNIKKKTVYVPTTLYKTRYLKPDKIYCICCPTRAPKKEVKKTYSLPTLSLRV